MSVLQKASFRCRVACSGCTGLTSSLSRWMQGLWLLTKIQRRLCRVWQRK